MIGNTQTQKNLGCCNNLGFMGSMNINQFLRHNRSEQILLEKVLIMRTQGKFKTKLKRLLSEIKAVI